MRFILAVLIFIMSSGLSYATELKIGLIPEQNVFKQMKKYGPVGDYIEKKTGIKIKFTVLTRYGNIIDNFNSLKLDGAFWGSFTGALAIKKLGIEHLARPVNPDGESTYKGLIFVHKYSIIDSVERMRHKVIAFVDRATTAGYVFPIAYLREHGVTNIDTFFKEHYFTGSHDAAVLAVLNKEADIGCAKNTVFNRMALENPEVKDNLVIIAESAMVPSNGLGLKKDVAPEIKEKLKQVLINMNKDPEGQKILKDYGALSFIETKEKDYEPVFDLARKAGMDLATYKYTNE